MKEFILPENCLYVRKGVITKARHVCFHEIRIFMTTAVCLYLTLFIRCL